MYRWLILLLNASFLFCNLWKWADNLQSIQMLVSFYSRVGFFVLFFLWCSAPAVGSWMLACKKPFFRKELEDKERISGKNGNGSTTFVLKSDGSSCHQSIKGNWKWFKINLVLQRSLQIVQNILLIFLVLS